MTNPKVSVTITHRAPGIHPPVYVAGSFSDPQWVPQPMEYTTGEDGVHTFTKTLQVEPKSKIAYKYRVGEGDWWILNEDAPTVTDEAGNRNNFLQAPEAPEALETMQAPKATLSEENILSEEPTVEPTKEPTESKTEEQNQTSTEDTILSAGADIEQPHPVPKLEALKQSDQVDREMSSTPEIAAEVAASAAMLDLPTPEPEVFAELAGKSEEDLPSATPIADIAEKAAEADIAAEVADTAATLDAGEPEAPLKTEPSSVDPVQDPADVAAEVADTAETLDADESEVPFKTETSSVDPVQDPADVAAEVADTAETLDVDEPDVHLETVPAAYQSLAGVKSDIKDDSPDGAGYSNEPEPVPLFAHECAGLYKNDEIPGVEDNEGRGETNGRLDKHNNEDFDDPTLEKFPSNKDEIMSAVRKVETGLNADQTSVEGAPLSPILRSRHSSTADVHSDHSEPDSPTSTRGQQSLSLPLPHSQQSLSERSLSASSLHSIAEGAEGMEAEKSKVEDSAPVVESVQTAEEPVEHAKAEDEETENSAAAEIAPVVEQAETADEVIQVAQDAEGEQAKELAPIPPTVEVSLPVVEEGPPVVEKTETADESVHLTEQATGEKVQESKAEQIAPLAEKTETAEEVIQVAKEAEGETTLTPPKPTLQPLVTVPSPSTKPSTGLLSPVSDEDEAVVLKSGNGKDKSAESARPGYLSPERAASPEPEEPGSPREPPPNAADPVAEHDLDNDVSNSDLAPAVSEPRSPQIVVSQAEEPQPEEDLLPASSLAERHIKESEAPEDVDAPNDVNAPEDIVAPKDVDAPKDVEAPNDVNAPEDVVAPKEVDAAKDFDRPKNIQAPESSETALVEGLQDTGSLTETAATSSALEESQAGSLMKRAVAKPNPADRTDTPTSMTEQHREAAKNGNWFSAFCRLIFVDFVGGFVSRLCGGRRKTLVTTVVVLVALGVTTYRRTIEAETQAD